MHRGTLISAGLTVFPQVTMAANNILRILKEAVTLISKNS